MANNSPAHQLYDAPAFISNGGSHVSIAWAEYQVLLRMARELDNLKTALYQGGIAPETLDVLINNTGVYAEAKDVPVPATAFAGPSSICALAVLHPALHAFQDSGEPLGNAWNFDEFHSGLGAGDSNTPHISNDNRFLRTPSCDHRPRDSHNTSRQTSNTYAYGDENLLAMADNMVNGGDIPPTIPAQAQSPYPLNDQRTLLITGLSDHITIRDLTTVIRGGRILDIYIRKDRAAIVTMLSGASAFLAHIRRHDLYIRSKRLDVHWHERQYKLHPHMARRLAQQRNAVSRNFVIRGGAHKLAEHDLRACMAHIHHLELVDVRTVNGGADLWVETNSVHNALFARTCLQSRAALKKCRIEWAADECAAPLPALGSDGRATVGRGSGGGVRTTAGLAAAAAAATHKSRVVPINRFNLLDLEDNAENGQRSGDDDYEGDDDKENEMPMLRCRRRDDGDELRESEDEDGASLGSDGD